MRVGRRVGDDGEGEGDDGGNGGNGGNGDESVW